jgi:hypothetical protein
MLRSPQVENTTAKCVETCLKTSFFPTALTANVATHNKKPQGGTFYILCALDDLTAEHETFLPEPSFSGKATFQV